MYQQLQSGKVWKNSNICNLRKDGSTYWVDTVIVPFIKDEKVESYVAIRTDISESKEVEFELEKLYEEAQTLIKEKESLFQEVQRLAYTDSLTTIPNRLSVMESFQKMLFLAQKESLTLTVMFLDLDGFKLINDTLNHEAGDRVLKDVAEILRNILKEDELYGRLGGDEFIIISLQTTQENTIITLCQELLEKINKIELPQNLQKSFGASIGVIYTKVSQETEIEFLLKKADNLMYEVKKKEKNNFLIQEVS
jgi:diguanylate cyclase (GGDEF)-like protein